nr:hypothetical protein [Tanacetum cinerariifolium]
GELTLWKEGELTLWKEGELTLWKEGELTLWKEGELTILFRRRVNNFKGGELAESISEGELTTSKQEAS